MFLRLHDEGRERLPLKLAMFAVWVKQGHLPSTNQVILVQLIDNCSHMALNHGNWLSSMGGYLHVTPDYPDRTALAEKGSFERPHDQYVIGTYIN
jgi:hypothetical protein